MLFQANTADSTIMKLEEQLQVIKKELSELQSRHSLASNAKEKAEATLKLVTEENNDVKDKLSLVSAELTSTKEVKNALERKVSLVEHELHSLRMESGDKVKL